MKLPVRFGGRGKALFVPTPIIAQTSVWVSQNSKSEDNLRR